MAELNVEPKKSSSAWWIILIIIIILIILYFVFRKGNNTNGNINTVKDSTGMILKNSRENNNEKNTAATYQWQFHKPANYS
ncbi:MAG TPA: hypothetical protein VN726_04060 [Hanamia sp.]|nr:hypothetical protein [Hanamia sp.]